MLVSSFFVVLVGAELILKAPTGPDGVVPTCAGAVPAVKVHDIRITASLYSYQAWRLCIGSDCVCVCLCVFLLSLFSVCVCDKSVLRGNSKCPSELQVVVSHPKQVLGSKLLKNSTHS